MSKTVWLLTFSMLSTGLIAQQVTNPPPAAPLVESAAAPAVVPSARAEAAPAKPAQPKPAKNGKAAKKAPASPNISDLRTTPLIPGPATVNASNVNVRGQAKLRSEVVARVTKGDQVTVLEEIVKNDSAADEPSAWARILLPDNTPVWVSTQFLANNTVVPPRLNVRAGPGENYSVLGLLQRGTEVKPITTRDGWTQIQQPADAYAFVAAQYLKQDKPGQIASTAPATAPAAETPETPAIPETPTTSQTVVETPAIAAAPVDAPVAPKAATETAPAAETPATIAATEAEAPNDEEMDEPPPKRIVQREGIVRGTSSIQAPSHFALVSPQNNRLINYLYTTSPNLDLRRYKGLRIIVTGEEALEERWGTTPVITIHKIDLLDE